MHCCESTHSKIGCTPLSSWRLFPPPRTLTQPSEGNHRCFFDNNKQQIGDAPLQLQGYRCGNLFYVKSGDLGVCSIPCDEFETWDDFCILFKSNQQHDLIVHLTMANSAIHIGKVCAAKRTSFSLAVRKSLFVSCGHCWAVLDLNAMEKLGGNWGLTWSSYLDDA